MQKRSGIRAIPYRAQTREFIRAKDEEWPTGIIHDGRIIPVRRKKRGDLVDYGDISIAIIIEERRRKEREEEIERDKRRKRIHIE